MAGAGERVSHLPLNCEGRHKANTAPEAFNKYDSSESIVDAFWQQFAAYSILAKMFHSYTLTQSSPVHIGKNLLEIETHLFSL